MPAGEALVRVLEQGNPGIIVRFGVEADLVKILQHPTRRSRATAARSMPSRAHPRYYGTFPRVLGRYVREQQALTWPDAIRKMTVLPAATIGMVDRGAARRRHGGRHHGLRPGDGDRSRDVRGADAAVGRDPPRARERCARAARRRADRRARWSPLRRTRHMPSRPMNGRELRAAWCAGYTASGRRPPSIEVRQPADTRHGPRARSG